MITTTEIRPSERRKAAWLALATAIVNESVRRGLFRLERMSRDSADDPPVEIATHIEVAGRRYRVVVNDIGFKEVRIEALATEHGKDRALSRLMAWVERRNGLWLQVPSQINYVFFSGFSRADQEALAVLQVEPEGYTFGPVVH